jgi:dipeptidyl aminopeptidase/acylaminoacyl peptidase
MHLLALLTGTLLLTMTASEGNQSVSNSDQPPILNRELFFGNPEISAGQLSPDGAFISFMKPYEGIMNVWVKRFDEPFDKARPLTDSRRPLYGYAWSEDGKYILYVKDNDGDENMNVWIVDPRATATSGPVPASRNLTPMEKVTAQIQHVSQRDPDLVWIGLNDRDEAWHDLYQLRLSTGELTLVYENTDRITGYDFDWDDRLRLLSRTDAEGNTVILRKDQDQLVPIYETSVTEGASIASWDEENRNIYLISNKGDLNLSTLFLMNPETGEKTLLESDPEGRVDFGSIRVDRNTRKVISTSYTDDRTRHYWRDQQWEENYKFLRSRFPGREVDFQSSTKDYSKFLIAVYGDKYASESWFFNAETRELIHQYTPRPELKKVEQHLAPMTPVRYPSSDGLEIPGYLTLPLGQEPRQLSLVVLVHGGPKGPRDNWGYDPTAQFLANRGYAVLQPNFRASGGYGKDFLNAGDLQWGKLMQDDITWGVKYLIEQGIADKDRVCIMGGSYGGYATLAGLAFTPDVYACGVDIVGPSNIFTLLDSIPAYWEAGRAFLYGMVGDPGTEEGQRLIREASPLFSAEKINKPLLIIQGANDPRVKQAEADQIVIALRDRGHDVSYLLAEDEGHGFAKPVNRMAMYAEIERFLAEKLGGRYQEDMPEEVAKRLAELRVDVDTVTYTPASAFQVAAALPELLAEPAVGQQNWDVTIEVQGQELKMKLNREISRQNGLWTVTDQVSSLMGDSSDSVVYDGRWMPQSRKLTQGPVELNAKYAPNQIELNVMGNPLQLDFEGALLCDGPGRDLIVAALKLEENQTLVVAASDLMSQKISLCLLQQEGTEKIGDRECLKISLTEVENQAAKTVFWIDAQTRLPVQVTQVVPALGNAKMTRVRIGN